MKRLYYNTVTPFLHEALKKLMSSPVFKGFRLVGGTGLSLQRGHRKSIDIDLFTDAPYGAMPINDISQFLKQHFDYFLGEEELRDNNLGYSVIIGDKCGNNVKLDLFCTDPFLFHPIEKEGLRIADERDIAAMKFLAIVSPVKRMKDFWDIHELLQDYNFSELVDFAINMHPYNISKEEIIESFDNLDDIDDISDSIETLKGEYWDLIKMDLKETIDEYKNSDIAS